MLEHLWRSETAFPSVASYRKWTKTSHRWLKHVTMVGSWQAEHYWRLESAFFRYCACAGIVNKKQLVKNIRSGTLFAPCPEEILQTVIDMYVRGCHFSILKQYGDKVAQLCKDTCRQIFFSTLISLDFAREVASGKIRTADACFISRMY